MRFWPRATTMGVVALMGCVTTVAVANVPPPEEPPPVRRKVVVRQSGDHNYRIVIPQSVLKDLKVAASDLELELQQPDESRWQHRSLLAALAVSAGMISLVLVRRKSTSTKVLAVMALAGAAYFVSHAYGDLAPPTREPKRPATKPAPRRPMIEIETTRLSHSVILYVPAHKPAAVDQGPPLGGLGTDSAPGIPGDGFGSPADPAKRQPTQSRPN